MAIGLLALTRNAPAVNVLWPVTSSHWPWCNQHDYGSGFGHANRLPVLFFYQVMYLRTIRTPDPVLTASDILTSEYVREMIVFRPVSQRYF